MIDLRTRTAAILVVGLVVVCLVLFIGAGIAITQGFGWHQYQYGGPGQTIHP